MTITGDRLRELRREKGKTLREVNVDTGISYSGLASIERGENSCNTSTLKILADYYNVPIDYLLCNNTTHPKDELTNELHNTIDKLNKGNKEFILKLAKTLIKEQ